MENIEKTMLKYESFNNKLATYDKDAIREEYLKKDIRGNYFRDTDKIIHSISYTKYMGKTQVYTKDVDYISKRITHVQFVSKAARTIARALGYNEDLCEAIALSHDLGHTPFGHEGEYILNDISIKNTGRYFKHNVHSVRVVREIENKGKGLNLTLQTIDGILCHNGEVLLKKYTRRDKTKEEIINEYKKQYTKNEAIIPMTIEGCIVRICDVIAYIGKDFEDAISLDKIIKIDESIAKVLGKTNSEIMNNIILDIINFSNNKDYIGMSDEIYDALFKLKKYNYDNIYSHAMTNKKRDKYTKIFNHLFNVYVKAVEEKEYKNSIYKYFLNNMDEKYMKNTTSKQMAIDFIAYQTDRVIVKEYNKYKEIKNV